MPVDPCALRLRERARRWALSVVARRDWWIEQEGGREVLGTAAELLGTEAALAMRDYIETYTHRLSLSIPMRVGGSAS